MTTPGDRCGAEIIWQLMNESAYWAQVSRELSEWMQPSVDCRKPKVLEE